MEPSAIERLQVKSPEEVVIEQTSRDFNLVPFMARTQFEQMRRYFEHHFGLERDVGQITCQRPDCRNGGWPDWMGHARDKM